MIGWSYDALSLSLEFEIHGFKSSNLPSKHKIPCFGSDHLARFESKAIAKESNSSANSYLKQTKDQRKFSTKILKVLGI